MTRKIAIAAVLLLGTMPLAYAQGTMGRTGAGGGAGASQLSPGHEMNRGGDADDRGSGASGYSPGHEMKERGTVGQSRSGLDRDRDDRRSMDRDDHRTTGQSRGGRDFDRDRDRGKGASEFSPGDRMRDKRY